MLFGMGIWHQWQASPSFGAADVFADTRSRTPPEPPRPLSLMGKRPKRDPVLSLSASSDATTPGQTAKLIPPRPSALNLEDVPEFQDEQRRQKQASQAQFVLQLVIVGTLIVRWFRGRNTPKPKPPRDSA